MRNTTEEVFASALALPASERDSFLMRACGADSAQLSRIRSLLADSAQSAEFMNEIDATVKLSDGSDRIDNYRLIQELGEGGCGTVFLAEQTKPIRREVALKIIKLGMDTKAVVTRFQAERQALALMDHANIARVLDAGATQSGRPYFVMEVVRGIKITEYCDQCQLTIRERLDLFVHVCSAVQHAHTKGIIHRDIKPSNILVTLSDGVPVIKVIDFGIAKAMHGRLVDEPIQTLVEQFMGTPAYVSPEQTQPGDGAVDTRSDVYSLGCLLYELLVGRTPIDESSLYEASLAEARERIATEIPVRPSKRVALLSAEQRAEIQAQRQAAQIQRDLHGDLDSIVMKCLEKNKENRYQSAHDLGRDIQRLLRNEPIEARPPSVMYSAKMFARRHRTIFAAALMLTIALMTGVAVSTWQAVRALRAERVSQQAIASLVKAFELTDPYREDDDELNAQSLFELARKTAYERLATHPKAQAGLLQAIGRIARRQGDLKHSSQLLRDAVSIYRRLGDRDANDPALCSALVDLTWTLRRHGDLKAAASTLREAEAVFRQIDPTRPELAYQFFLERGYMARELGTLGESRDYFETSARMAEEFAGPESLEMATALDALATIYSWTDLAVETERAARRALAIRAARLPPLNPSRVNSEQRLAEALMQHGRFDEATLILSDAARKIRTIFGANSLEVAQVHEALAHVTRGQRKFEESVEHSREAIRAAKTVQAAESTDIAHYRTTLAYTLFELARFAEAEIELGNAHEAFSTFLPPDHPYFSSVEYVLAEILLHTDRFSRAEQLLRACISRTTKSYPIPWRIARAESALGEALYHQDRKVEGERYILDSYPKLHAAPGVDRLARDRARQRVINLYKEQNRQSELAEFLARYPDPPEPSSRQLVTDREPRPPTKS